MRCFEMTHGEHFSDLLDELNNNMRCFEISTNAIDTEKEKLELNNNMRCFEID